MRGLSIACFFLFLPQIQSFQSFSEISFDDECQIESEEWSEDLRDTNGPLLPCDSLTSEWFECEDVTQLVADNSTKVS